MLKYMIAICLFIPLWTNTNTPNSTTNTPLLEAGELISADLPLSSIEQSCDVYISKPVSLSEVNSRKKQLIHTPFFAFKMGPDNKIDIRQGEIDGNNVELILTLLLSPAELKQTIARYISDTKRLQGDNEYANLSASDIITPDFVSLKVTGIPGTSTGAFTPVSTDAKNSVDLVIKLAKTESSKWIQEVKNKQRDLRFTIEYVLNAQIVISTSAVYSGIVSARETKIFQELNGSANAFTWMGNAESGRNTKEATTVTRKQKQAFEGALKSELMTVYRISNEAQDDYKILSEQLDKYYQEFFKKASIDPKQNFADELARLSAFDLSIQNDITADEISSFVTKLTSFLEDKKQEYLNIEGSAEANVFSIFSGKAGGKYSKAQITEFLKNNGWDLEVKGKIVTPKSVEIWMLNDAALKTSGVFSMQINRVASGKFSRSLQLSSSRNLYRPEASNFATFYNEFMANSCPVGTILHFAGDTSAIPVGWKLCDGSPLKKEGNEKLFAVIGYIWGKEADGRFKLPDFRGVFLRGLDGGKGIDPGRRLGEIQDDALKNHSHTYQDAYFAENGSSSDRLFGSAGGKDDDNRYYLRHENGSPWLKTDGGEGTKDETRPKNYAVNYIIRAN